MSNFNSPKPFVPPTDAFPAHKDLLPKPPEKQPSAKAYLILVREAKNNIARFSPETEARYNNLEKQLLELSKNNIPVSEAIENIIKNFLAETAKINTITDDTIQRIFNS